MINKKALAQTGLVTTLLVLALPWAGCKRAAHTTATASAPEVLVQDVVQMDVPVYGDWIGTLDGLVNAQIHAQVSGYLLSQHYQEGDLVHQGDLLFQIDPRPFQAALDRAQGQMAEAQANLDLTSINVKRYTPLARENAISQQELDNAVQADKAAQAALESARAAVQQAALNLEFTRIVAPIDGIAGIAKAQIGDLVGPTSPELTAVSKVDPIKAYFPISEQEYMRAMEKRIAQDTGAAGKNTNELELVLADGSLYPHKGAIALADRQVNIQTGTILIAGLFPNPGNLLRPGQYAHIRFIVSNYPGALLVPQRAVTEIQGAYQVAVVDKDNNIVIRPVVAGERSGSLWIIKKGLQPGERVVVEGAQKLRAGASVTPKPYVAENAAPASGGPNKALSSP